MKKTPNHKPQLLLNNAYREVNLIDENANRIVRKVDGPKEFEDLFRPIQFEEGVQIEKQPIYFDQVDHNIQEIGIMTVKEVKYLTDEEWQEWVKGRENVSGLSGVLEPLKTYKYESRHNLAVNRNRNEKGQFLSKPKQKKGEKGQKGGRGKKKKIQKRGRKPKNASASSS